MGGRLSEQERLHYDQYIQVPCSCVLSNTINDLHSYSDCDLNKFWQFILEQSIQVSSPVTMVLIILFLKVVIFPECRPLLELSGEVQCLGALSGKYTSHREINKIQNLKNTQLNTELKNTTLKNQHSVLASPPSQHAGFSVQGFRCACHQNRC